MSLSSNHGNGNGGQGRGRGQGPPPQAPMMVQTILESFTRCLYPLEPCAKACAAKTESVVRNRRRANSSSPVNAGQLFFGKAGGGGGGSLSAPASRAVSRSSSSSDRRRSRGAGRRPNDHVSLDASCDADGVSRAKKEARRRRPRAATTEYTPQDLAERSTKRKLEIFRGTGSDGGGTGRRQRPPAPKRTTTTTRGNDDRPRNPHRRHDPPPHGGHPARQSSEPSRPASPLALSDDEEELVRLAHDGGRRGRFACGMNMGRFSPSRRRDDPSSPPSSSDRGGGGGEGPISSVARLFNRGLTEAQKPFGLCFATPVRTASGEDARNLSDDKLTDEEFLRRHCGPEEATPRRPEGEGGAVVTPGGEEGGMSGSPGECGPDRSSYCEEETISSTLYLDAQYSHVVQTRPPMPLFQEQLVAPGEEDGLNEILRRRSAAAAAVQAEEARRSASSHPPSFPVRELHARTSVRRKVSNGSSSGSLGSPRKKSPRKGGCPEEGGEGGGSRRGFRMEATGTPPRGATGTMEEVPSVRTVSAGSSRSGVGGGGAPPRASPPREGSPKASHGSSPKSSPKNSPKRSPRGFFRLGPRAAEF